jgi:hypothetical protein
LRGVFAKKNTSREMINDTGIFSQIPLANMIYLFNFTEYQLSKWKIFFFLYVKCLYKLYFVCWLLNKKIHYGTHLFGVFLPCTHDVITYLFILLVKYIFINVWRKIVFDICFTGFGADLTTVLPVLFKYCCKYCYSDSRKLWAVMKGGGLAL